MTERVLALVLLVASGAYVFTALSLPRGAAARPGPGFFPLAVGVLAVIAALLWVAGTLWRTRAGGARPAFTAEGRGRVVAAAAVLVGFCLALPWTGYPVAAMLFVSLLLRRLGSGWMGAIVVGLASAAVSYYLFAAVLGVPLPRGVLFD